jgi:chlorobactene glucosyltransferase
MLAILFITAALIVISLITLSNLLLFPRLERAAAHGSTPEDAFPRVSILIPARDEAEVIGETVARLLAQDYPDFEVVVLDDDSQDGTAMVARRAGSDSARLRIIAGEPLPEGWAGKNWACQQMAGIASGDYLIFTDADVQWKPDALRALMREALRTRADLLTVWPTQQAITWSERLCVPLMALVVIGYLPVIGAHHLPLAVFGAANGQCMIWRRGAYQALGGHWAVRDNVLEDVTLARMVKGRGYRLRMVDGNRLITCRMYTGWDEVRDGFAKNILQGYGGSAPLLALATIFHLLIFVFPWLWLAFGWAFPALAGWPLWPLALITLGLTIRAATAAFTRQRVIDALSLPLATLLMTRIALQSVWWQHTHGGPRWKGRVIRRNDGDDSAGENAGVKKKPSHDG